MIRAVRQKKMIARIRDWFLRQRDGRRAVEIARKQFKDNYPDRQLVGWNLEPTPIDDGKFVVIVCHGPTRPPARYFWRVDLQENRAIELSHDEAGCLIAIPIWR